MSKEVNYYNILSISIFASDEEIKTAYLKKIKEYHPDTYKGNKHEAENITASLNDAYAVLRDKTKKQVYDEKFGFDKEREIFFAQKAKDDAKAKKIADRKAKKARRDAQQNAYATERQKQKEAQKQQQFNEQTKVQDQKIKTNIFTKQPKKEAVQKKHFVLTDEQKAMRKERITLDIFIILLIMIVILLIIFK